MATGARDYALAWYPDSGFAGRDGVSGIYAEVDGIDDSDAGVPAFAWLRRSA